MFYEIVYVLQNLDNYNSNDRNEVHGLTKIWPKVRDDEALKYENVVTNWKGLWKKYERKK